MEIHNGIRVGATTLWETIAIEYEISKPGNPGVVFHELNHYWCGNAKGFWDVPDDLDWLNEGLASFLPIAMARSNWLDLADSEFDHVMRHWGTAYPVFNADTPVGRDYKATRGVERNFHYAKSFKILYLIHGALGPEGLEGVALRLASPRAIHIRPLRGFNDSDSDDDTLPDGVETASGLD